MKKRADSNRDKPVPIRFTADDLALIARLQAKTGIGSRADVIRLALRRLAEKEKA